MSFSDMTQLTNPSELVSRGIVDLQVNHPFFSFLLMQMRFESDNNTKFKTMQINAKGHLKFDDEFVKQLARKELQGVLCHEVLHVAMLHFTRTGTRNREVANIAQDISVNMIVKKSGLQLPKDGIPVNVAEDSSTITLNQKEIKIENVSEKAWEEIYAEIISNLKQTGVPPPPNAHQQAGGFDQHPGEDESDALTPQEKAEVEQKWQSAIVEAAQYAKKQGKLPAGMARHIDDLLKPQVQWKSILLKYMKQHTVPVDWSYQKPHKKSKLLGVYMPNVLKESCEVEIVIDTSGSITNKELSEFMTEVVAISNSMNHVKMNVSFWDAKLASRYELDSASLPEILRMRPAGGGGTDMEGALDWIKENNREVPVAIVLTDGYTSFNKHRNSFPFEVIWVVTKNGYSEQDMREIIPYGMKIKMD